jgi:hypothetical protein
MHWQDGKMILRYIAGTTRYGILYSRTMNFNVSYMKKRVL